MRGKVAGGRVRSGWATRAPLVAALVVAFAGAGPRAAADPPAPSADAVARAKEHYERAKELYRAGRYREAIAEIEAARALDPYAKQLVFNLALLHEKLGEIDLALGFMREFLKMDLTAEEREKAEAAVKRLEGARHEVPVAPPSAATTPPPAPAAPAAPPAPPPAASPPSDAEESHPETGEAAASPGKGRFDALTAAAGVVAIAGLGVGIYFGLKATSDRPSNYVTGVDGTFADFQRRTDDAHSEAIKADIGFGVGILAAAATALLYFSRTAAAPASPGTSGLVVAPTRDGGAVLWRGAF